MKKIFLSILTASATVCLVSSSSVAETANGSGASGTSIGGSFPTPNLVPIAATSINGLIQAESLQQKLAEDRAAFEKQLAADKAAAEQRSVLKEETIAVVPESIELPEIETPDSPDWSQLTKPSN